MTLFGLFPQREAPSGIETLRDLLTAQDDRIRALERGHKSLELEWENVYDKLHKGLSRLNKRARDLAKAEVDPGSTNEVPAEVHPASDFRARVLSRRRHA